MEKPDLEGLRPFEMITAVALWLSWIGVPNHITERVISILKQEPEPGLRERCDHFIVLAPHIAKDGRIPGRRRWWQFWRRRNDRLRRGPAGPSEGG
jgi:hypothetical protein